MKSRWYLIFLLFLFSCESEYDQLVKAELAKGERHEKLLFDFVFNQSRDEFYAQCWEMNKSNTISQGPKNVFAMYMIEPGTIKDQKDKIEMLFYGLFDDQKIMRGLDLRYSYPKWSVWSKEYHSDKLIPVLKNYFLDKFPGNDFLTIPLKSVKGNSYVKVDKNRQILMYALDTKDVVVKIEDLEHKLSKNDLQ